MQKQRLVAADPNEPPLSRRRPRRLYGWRLDPQRGTMLELPRGFDGRLWSEHLHWLVPDGSYLRLYDAQGMMHLTRTEAKEAALRRAEEEVRRAEALAERLRSLGINPDQL